MTQAFEFNGLRLLGRHHLFVIRHMILGIGEFLLFVTQGTHPSPTAPLLQSLMDIGDALCHWFSVHPFITVDREFAALFQITVFLDEGIEFLDRGIAFQLSHDETGGLTIAGLFIIVIEGLEVIQLIPHDTQQVVVEITTV